MPRLRLDPTAPNGISIAPDDPSMGQLRRQNNGYVVNKATGLIKAGTNVTLSGSGVSNDPYIINSSGTGSGTTLPADAAGWLHDDGAGTLAWSTPSKSDVGLGNVDNTSDATKNSAVAILTNKDLTSGTNTFPTLNQDTTGKSAKTDALNSATTTINVAAATAPTSGQVLTATSSTAATWQTPASGGMSNPMMTLGDMIYEDSTPIQTRLAGNTTTTKKFLTQTGTGSASAAPAWGTIAAADVPTLNQNTTGTASNVTGTVAVGNGGTGATTLTGLVKGNGTSAMTAATAGTDYISPTGTETMSNKTLTTPKIAQINDTNGKTEIIMDATTSAVNYLHLANAATGNAPAVTADGTDTNINLFLRGKGTGTAILADGSGNAAFVGIGAGGTPVNYITATNAATTAAPFVAAAGSDTNIDLNLKGKGTGEVQANGVPVATTTDAQTFSAKTFSDYVQIQGNASAPVTPGAGLAKLFMAGTSNVTPKFMNESGTLRTIMTGVLNTQTNTGTAGGSINYIDNGLYKMAWGISAAYSVAGNSTTSGTVTLPTSFFSTITGGTISLGELTTDARQFPYFSSATTTTTATLSVQGMTGSSTAIGGKWYWVVYGT